MTNVVLIAKGYVVAWDDGCMRATHLATASATHLEHSFAPPISHADINVDGLLAVVAANELRVYSCWTGAFIMSIQLAEPTALLTAGNAIVCAVHQQRVTVLWLLPSVLGRVLEVPLPGGITSAAARHRDAAALFAFEDGFVCEYAFSNDAPPRVSAIALLEGRPRLVADDNAGGAITATDSHVSLWNMASVDEIGTITERQRCASVAIRSGVVRIVVDACVWLCWNNGIVSLDGHTACKCNGNVGATAHGNRTVVQARSGRFALVDHVH